MNTPFNQAATALNTFIDDGRSTGWTTPALKDINAAIAKLVAAETALGEACEVMRLHSDEVDGPYLAATRQFGFLLATFCRLYGERVKLDGDPELASLWGAMVGEAPAIPGLYRCRVCKALWSLHMGGDWSVAPSSQPGRCCDNHPGFISRLERA